MITPAGVSKGSPPRRADDPFPVGSRNCVGATVDTQLSELVLDVRGDGLPAEYENRRCIRLGLSFGQQQQDLALPWAEIVGVTVRSSRGTTPTERSDRSSERRMRAVNSAGSSAFTR